MTTTSVSRARIFLEEYRQVMFFLWIDGPSDLLDAIARAAHQELERSQGRFMKV
jgi:hypothetical protein